MGQAQKVAAQFGVPVENVRKQYAVNAVMLRGLAKRAAALGQGCKLRGKTSEQWTADAERFEGFARDER
jgi:hypothetical protein